MQFCVQEEDEEMLALLQPFWMKQQSKLQSKHLLQTCTSLSSAMSGSIEEFKIVDIVADNLFALQEASTEKQTRNYMYVPPPLR
jgi:hypothetical protein